MKRKLTMAKREENDANTCMLQISISLFLTTYHLQI
jgi:hypothetical protein